MEKASILSAVGLIVSVVLLFSANPLRAQEWDKVGYGSLGQDGRFDVYVDTRTILRVGDKVRFWQGHVFYSEQKLPSGAGYMRVSIEREGDCKEMSDASLQAIFYARDGSMVTNYSGDSAHKPSGSDTIRRRALEFVCNYKK